MPLGRGSRLDVYELVSPLGAGGMGEVWLATEVRLGRKVALKFIPAELSQDAARVSRLQQEARAASALSHPNVCTILALGQSEDGQHYIAMEYVEGETLRRRLTHSRPTLREAVDVAVQIASALSVAHAAGIVHRDIKPENVMIRPDGFAKVLDFGLSKLVAASGGEQTEATQTALSTEAGTIVGTVAYMSPEQTRGQRVDARTDIWSLGCVLYEMVVGRSPFAGETRSDVIAAILEREPAPIARFEPDVPPELQRIVTKTLRKNPKLRYQATRDLLLDLQVLREELQAQARSGSSSQESARHEQIPELKSSRWKRRGFRPVLIATAVVTLLGLAAAGLMEVMGAVVPFGHVWLWPSGYELTVQRPVHGTLTAPGIRCGTNGTECSTIRPKDEIVEFTPMPDPGFTFMGFSGDCAPDGHVTMTGPRTCSAMFSPMVITTTSLPVPSQTVKAPEPTTTTTVPPPPIEREGPPAAHRPPRRRAEPNK